MQDIQGPPTFFCHLHGKGQLVFPGHIRRKCCSGTTLLNDHRRSFLSGLDLPINGQDVCPFTRKSNGRCPTVAHAFARALSRTNNNSDLPSKPPSRRIPLSLIQ
ncbi:hypothetical protein D3C84_1115480 [compost metagenome]